MTSFSCGFLVILFFCLNPTGESRRLWGPGDIASNGGLRYNGKPPLSPPPPTLSFQSPFLARTLRTSLLFKVELNFLWPKGSQEGKPLLGKRALLRTCSLIPDPPKGKANHTQVTTPATSELSHSSDVGPDSQGLLRNFRGQR